MEQVGYTHHQHNHFPRNIRKLVDGKNSLFTYFNDDNVFKKRWKENYVKFVMLNILYPKNDK